MAGVPFKVSIPGMSRSGLQVGIVANSLKHLGQILEERLGLSEHAQIYLDDGTLVCDQEYFELLEPQTKLTVVEGRDDLQEPSLGEKRPMVVPADSASSLPTKQRRTSLSAEAFDSSMLASNTSCNNNLVSCLRISRVEENVPMQSSPTPTCKPLPRPNHSPPLRDSYPVISPPHSIHHVMLPSHNPHSTASPHTPTISPHPIMILPNPHQANPPTLHYQPFPDPFNHQQFLLPQQAHSQVLRPEPSLPQPSLPQPSLPQPSLPQPSLPQPSLPQPSLSQPSLPQPSLPQPSLPQPSLPQPSFPQPSLPQPSFPQPSLPQPSLPQPSLPQPSLPQPSIPQPSLLQPSFPQPSLPQSSLLRPSLPRSSLHSQLQPSLIPIPRPQTLLLPQPTLCPIQTYYHPTPSPWNQVHPAQHGSLHYQPPVHHQQAHQQTLPIPRANCNQQSSVVMFPRMSPDLRMPPDLVLLQAQSQPPDTTFQQAANRQQFRSLQCRVPGQQLKPVEQPSPLIHMPIAQHQALAPLPKQTTLTVATQKPTPLPKQAALMVETHHQKNPEVSKPHLPLMSTIVATHHQKKQDMPTVSNPHLPLMSTMIATHHQKKQDMPAVLSTASTPIPGVRAVLGAAQCPVSVVNSCTDLGSGEESDDEDEDKLCIIEDHESSCSGAGCESSNPLDTTANSDSVHSRDVTSELVTDPDNHIQLEPLTIAASSPSSAQPVEAKPGSLDEGYSSSTSFSSLASVSNKLPFADFDTGSTPESPLTPDGPCEADFQLWEEQVISPRSPKCSDEVSGGVVDVSAEEDLHKAIGSEESVKEVFPTGEEPSEEVELLVSIPVQWENGQLLCQHDSKGEEVMASAEGDVELVVSIPVCWEDHQIKHFSQGVASEDLANSGQYVTAESTSSMDELGQCPEVCTLGKHACKTGPPEDTGVPVGDGKVVAVEEYACEKTVLSTQSLGVCTEIDIDRCVAQIMSKVLTLQSGESEQVSAGTEELAVSIPIEYEPVPPSMQVKELPLDALLTVDNVGNEVVVSCVEEDLGDDEMAEVCLDFPHLEEVEIEVVDMMEIQESSAGVPEEYHLLPFSVKHQLFTEKINHLLHIADTLSEEDSREIEGFFSSTSLDPRKGIQRYTLMQRMHGGKYICLELNFTTGKWRGIILG